jgi:hypothetical protein
MNGGNNSIIRWIGMCCALLTAMLSAPAAFAQTATGNGEAVIVTPLSLVSFRDLNFGNLIAGTATGTVTVSPASVRSTTGGVTPAGGTVTSAQFAGFGTVNRFIRITTAQATYNLTRVNGTETMRLRNLTVSASNVTLFLSGRTVFGRIDPNGIITLNIGGTIDVGANQVPGVYEGTFPITVDYF